MHSFSFSCRYEDVMNAVTVCLFLMHTSQPNGFLERIRALSVLKPYSSVKNTLVASFQLMFLAV